MGHVATSHDPLTNNSYSGVEAWFSPSCRDAYLSCELFLSRADLSKSQESHANNHPTPLMSSRRARNKNTDQSNH